MIEFVDKEVNEALNKELSGPILINSFMGKSVVESTMDRVKQHLNSSKGFFIISTHLPDMEPEEELRRVSSLREELTQRGLGYIPLRGKYTRDNGQVEYEYSFFVPSTGLTNTSRDVGYLKEMAIELCGLYGQDAVVYAQDGKAYFLDSKGKMSYLGNTTGDVEEINEFWSKLRKGRDRNRHWVFESLYPASNYGLNAAKNWGELLK